ncbi:hypothetical protein AXG93_3506s1100 [Marchantia polymorpha subsp. ruderalis]|uniref:Reverse transcriptase Ty1/copia-type domain-containing protein n=1 Tax=Marchantia polymorpha subsp. ruderalis TaxID=1480154 RepID=A0A176VNP8_MARPO|nr:hypothetical protein AXG93_3506s1100 [Marchantia polymorpha subsp. ruderalis]
MSKVPYANAVGSLMYAMVCTRQNIAFAVSVVSRFMAHLGREHWQAVKRIFRILMGSVVSWKATLQPTVTLSTTEVEYMALKEAAKEGIWLKHMVNDLGLHQDQAIVHCDSLSAICLTKDQVHYERMKHIDVRYHFLRNKSRIKVKKVRTVDNPADMFTKPDPKNKFQHCLELLNIMSQ